LGGEYRKGILCWDRKAGSGELDETGRYRLGGGLSFRRWMFAIRKLIYNA
jgi:hypothetical protein